MKPHWLPQIVAWKQTLGELWKDYVCRLYRVFRSDFVLSPPYYLKQKVKIKRMPRQGIYPYTFVHLITKDLKDKGGRLPDPRRAERIKWPKAIIDNYSSCITCNYRSCSKPWVWETKRNSHIRIKFYLSDQKYLVVLEKRKDYYLLITAYCVTYTSRWAQLEQEYNNPVFSKKIL